MSDYGNGPYYGGGGSGGGGGFFASQSSPGGRKPPAVSLRPVTIKQILNANQPHADAEFTIDDTEPTQILFVAQVVGCEAGATNIVYNVTDGSGILEVRQWLNNNEDPEAKVNSISHLAWVRVIGNIKSFHNKRSVTAAHIHVVTDMAEIFYHQVEALSVHLYFTKGPLTESGALATSSGAAGVPSDYTAAAVRGGADQYADMEPLQRQILMFMKNTITDENGSSVIEIANAVKKTGATADKISEAIDALTDNGFIYASIDDEHYIVA